MISLKTVWHYTKKKNIQVLRIIFAYVKTCIQIPKLQATGKVVKYKIINNVLEKCFTQSF